MSEGVQGFAGDVGTSPGDSELRLRLALDAAAMGTFIWHVKEDRTEADPRMVALFDQPPGGQITLRAALATMLHPDDREPYAQAVARSMDPAGDGALREDIRVLLKDGGLRWLAVTGQVYFEGEPREPARMAGAVVDITARKATEEALRQGEARLQMLVAELQHRTRNLIAVVQSMCARTVKESGSLGEFHERYQERLGAVSRVQGLLGQLQEGQRLTFGELLEAELAAHRFADSAIDLKGPAEVRLRSSAAQIFALALHELATNSVKFGALSAGGGRLEVRWRVDPAEVGGDPMLHVEWLEEGGQASNSGSLSYHSGYGRELIERALPYQLKATTTYELKPDGMRCTISAPVVAEAEAGLA